MVIDESVAVDICEAEKCGDVPGVHRIVYCGKGLNDFQVRQPPVAVGVVHLAGVQEGYALSLYGDLDQFDHFSQADEMVFSSFVFHQQ